MWKRKKIKQSARSVFRKNYWAAVAVCFLMAFLVGSYGTSLSAIEKYNYSDAAAGGVGSLVFLKSNGGVLGEFLKQYDLPGTYLTDAVVTVVDSMSTSDSTILYDSLNIYNKALANRKTSVFVILGIAVLISLLYKIFVANILRVGECRFFLETRKYKDTRVTKILYLYKYRIFKNPAKVMFLRWLFNGLWYLTIIGGVIKAYEYRMIPYILAENQDATHKQVFALSKEMMKGQKWKVFLLDMSFIGWLLLNVLTLGLVGILFTNGYVACTNAELYSELRKRAMEEKKSNYEVLNDLYL